MKPWLLVCLAIGLADAKTPPAPAAQIELLVRTFLGNIHTPAKLRPTLRTDAIVVVEDTIARDADGDSAASSLGWLDITTIGKPAIQLDNVHHAAWFQGTAMGVTVDQSGDRCRSATCPPAASLALHVAGLALDRDGSWQLAVMIVSSTRPDADTIELRRPHFEAEKLSTQHTQTGEAELAKTAAAWIDGGHLHTSVAPGTTFATGTTNAELATGAAAAKLAAKWDRMKLAAVTLDAKTLDDGLGFVYADVGWPYKPDITVRLRFAAIAVRHGEVWEWAVVDFN